MLDIDAEAQIVALLVYRPEAQLLLASNAGRGFAAEADELLAETRKGRGGDEHQAGRQAGGRARDRRPSTITSRWSATTASW